jgi:MFS family permease
MYNPRTSHRLAATIFVSQSLFTSSQIAVFTMLAIMATELSGTESASGLPSSTMTFAQAFMAYPAGIMMGRFGRRFGLSFGYGLGALGALLGVAAILQGAFQFLLLSALLMGMGRASADQSRFAAGELYPANRRARMMGIIVFAGTVGAVAGPQLVPPVNDFMQSIGLNRNIGAWMIACVFYTLAMLITFLLLRPDPMTIGRQIAGDEERAKNETLTQPARPVRELFSLPMVQLAVLAMLISQTVMVVLMTMTPLYMKHHHHGDATRSMVLSAHTLGMFGLSFMTGYLIDRFGRIATLIMGALTLVGAALLAPLSTNEYVLAIASFLLGLGWNFGYVAGSSLLADTLQGAEKVRAQGVNDTLVAFAAGLGNVAAGPLFQHGGYFAVSIAGLGLTVIFIALIYKLSRPQFKAKVA